MKAEKIEVKKGSTLLEIFEVIDEDLGCIISIDKENKKMILWNSPTVNSALYLFDDEHFRTRRNLDKSKWALLRPKIKDAIEKKEYRKIQKKLMGP